jgi:Phage tail protein
VVFNPENRHEIPNVARPVLHRPRWPHLAPLRPGGPGIRDGGVGIASPPADLTALELPGGGGGLPQACAPLQRPIIVGLYAWAGDQAEFLTLVDRLARAFWTRRGERPAPGTLTVRRPDGTRRQIRVLVTDGADQADDDRGKSGLTWTTYTITFTALDPFWEDAQPQRLEFGGPPPEGTGVPPMPPVTLAPGALIGAVTVTNSGDADAYPVWTVTGPGAAPTLANTTTGKSFGMAVPLAAGETVTIDTRPTMQSAVDSAGRNRWPDLVKAGPRQLWPLVPGENVVDLRMAGVAPGSRIVLSFVRRWLRA